MYNLYLKGLSTDNQELNQIRTLFKENGLEFTNVFNDYASLSFHSKIKLTSEINDQIRNCNPTMQNINLICHSMGCNLGTIVTERSSKIKSLILISPKFGEYSKKEKRKIEEAKAYPSVQRPFGEKSKKISKETARSIILFNRTKPWSTLAIERINVPILIIYSKDDIFIPKEYWHNLANRKNNIEIEEINSKLHNPLSSIDHKQKTINLIKSHLK